MIVVPSALLSLRPAKLLLNRAFFYRAAYNMSSERNAILLGVYEPEVNGGEATLTRAASQFQAEKAENLSNLIQMSGVGEKKGRCRVFYDLDPDYQQVAVVNLGKKSASFNNFEELDEGRENTRVSVAAGIQELQENGASSVSVATFGYPEAVAEAATLCLFEYDDLKAKKSSKKDMKVSCFTEYTDQPTSVKEAWTRGVILGEGQNLARYLMEAPANVMTPTRFADIAKEKFENLELCQVHIRDKAWAEEKKMGGFLSVARGSNEPLKFVEVHYNGGKEDEKCVALVGKGITFDSGGISIKPSANMDHMRADMGGGACVLSSIYTAARLKVPINIKAFIPLCENMPSGHATKPGDVVTAMNGKTIQVDNTDAEGRLILCDALVYAQTFQPEAIIDMATLTGAIGVALGAAATGVFTNSNKLWSIMHKAGGKTGDRVWRMPLFKLYNSQMTKCTLADINNLGSDGRAGGSCTAAAFLKAFVEHDHWMHMDIAGVMMNSSNAVPYLGKSMSGRPTRTVVEFLSSYLNYSK